MSDSAPELRRAHLKEVPNEAPADSFGAELRSARLRLGEDYRSISKELRIRAEYLEALETGDLEILPGRPYAIGFLKTYASFLGLDPTEMVVRFKAENADENEPDQVPLEGLPDLASDFRMPQGAVIIVGLVLLLLLFLGVHLFRSASEQMNERVVAPPPVVVVVATPEPTPAPAPAPAIAVVEETPIAPEGEEAATVAGEDEAAVAEPVEEAAALVEEAAAEPEIIEDAEAEIVAEVEAIEEAAVEELPAPVVEEVLPRSGPAHEVLPGRPAPTSAAVTSAPLDAVEAGAASADEELQFEQVLAEASRTFGATTRENRVVLRAHEEVFVRVETEGARSQVLFEGMLGASQLYFVPAVDNVILVTRNGGALDVFVDGASKGKAGPEGIALKGLSLDPEALGGGR